MRFLPVFFDPSAGVIILIGSGEAALGKLRLLRAAGAHVRWFSPSADIAEETVTVAGDAHGRLEISIGDPLKAELNGVIAIVAAAGKELDAQISERAREHGVPVNIVDRPDLSTFIFPAIVDRGEVVVAIGTGGSSPVLARRLRERIEEMLPARIGELADLLGRHRSRFAAVPRALSPRRFWQDVIAGPIGAAALAGRSAEAERELVAAIDASEVRAENDKRSRKTETVFLVGAGPGDPDLLTLRALHALGDADIIFHDESVGAGVLDRARRGAERVFVGTRSREQTSSFETARRVVEAAQAGKRVVWLRGGDAFAAGRAGEEFVEISRAGVPVAVVPGVASASVVSVKEAA